jgi:cell division protein FtsB
MINKIHPGTRLESGVRAAKSIYAVRRRIATVAAATLTIGLGYHVVFGRNGLFVYQQKRIDSRTLNGELQTLQQENSRLQVHVDRLQSDPDAIEHQAREELHYTRPGEVIYTLPAQTPAETPSQASK